MRISLWAVVGQRGDENTVRSMIDVLRAHAPQLGIEMREPEKSFVAKDEPKSYVDSLKAIQMKVVSPIDDFVS